MANYVSKEKVDARQGLSEGEAAGHQEQKG